MRKASVYAKVLRQKADALDAADQARSAKKRLGKFRHLAAQCEGAEHPPVQRVLERLEKQAKDLEARRKQRQAALQETLKDPRARAAAVLASLVEGGLC